MLKRIQLVLYQEIGIFVYRKNLIKDIILNFTKKTVHKFMTNNIQTH